MRKLLLLISLFFLFILLALYSCKKPANPYAGQAIINANNAIIDSLKIENIRKDSVIEQLQKHIALSNQKQKEITKSFKPVYEKINSSSDYSEQLSYTKMLLAKSDSIPFTRY